MNDPIIRALFFCLLLSGAMACGDSPRYETSRGGSLSDTVQTPAYTDTARDTHATGQRAYPRTDSIANDSCIAAAEIVHRAGFTYHRGRIFNGVACSYFGSGELHTVTNYENGRRSGVWVVYYPNGVVEKSGTIRSGVEDGKYFENHPNGNRRYEYHYDMGTRTGKWLSWYEDGTPYTERNFRNGMLDGKVLVWDERGNLAKEYDYVHGRMVNSIMHPEEN